MGIWTRGKPQGAALVVPGSDSPFPACLCLRRLPEVRSQTLPSLCSLLFQPRHPLQMVKENPPLRIKDKASSCHECFPNNAWSYRSPRKVITTDSESPEKTWAVYFSQGPTVIWVIRQFWKSLMEWLEHDAAWWKTCVLFQPLPLTRCRIWISFNVSESELSCL